MTGQVSHDAPTDHLGVGFVNAAYPLANPAISDAIGDALESYGNLPQSRDDLDWDVSTNSDSTLPRPFARHVVRCVPCLGL